MDNLDQYTHDNRELHHGNKTGHLLFMFPSKVPAVDTQWFPSLQYSK